MKRAVVKNVKDLVHLRITRRACAVSVDASLTVVTAPINFPDTASVHN